MEKKGRLIVTFLVISVVIGVIAYFILQYLFSMFFFGYPGIAEGQASDPALSTGIASGAFAIMFLMYPVYKYGDRASTGDDFR